MPKQKLRFADAIASIKTILGFAEPAAGDQSSADALKDYTTVTGVKIKIDKLEVGGKLYKEDGVTLLDAGVTLSDGTVIEADGAGVITAITVATDGTGGTATETPGVIAMNEMIAKFATGTPEERITNLETMCKALMQNTLGWKIDEATRKSVEEQAIAVYRTLDMPQQFTEQIEAEKTARVAAEQKFGESFKMVLKVLEQFGAEPADDPAHGPADKPPAETKQERAQRLISAAKEARDNRD